VDQVVTKSTLLNNISKSESVSLLELMYNCAQCEGEDDYKKLFESLKELTQHDYCTTGIASVGEKGINGKYDLVNVDYPIEWMELYLEKEFNNIDPVVKENFTAYRTTFWADLYKEHQPPKEFISLAEDFTISNGVTSGVRNFRGTKGSLFSFAGNGIENNKRTALIISLIVPHLTIALRRMLAERNKFEANLSQRELEVLKWVAFGKSNWDISILLNISERTVEYHLSNIMHKLDATNRTYAVAIAFEQGLLTLD